MIPHSQTVFVALVLIVGVSVVLQTLNWHLHRNMRGPALWVVGASAHFLGLLLVALRGQLQEAGTVLVSNLLLIAGTVAMRHGLRMFAGLRHDYRLPLLLLMLALPGLGYFAFIEPSFARRWVIVAIVVVPLMLSMLRALRVIAVIDRGIGATTLTTVLIGNMLFVTATAVAMVVLESDAAGPFAPSQVLPYAFLFILVLEVVRTYSYLLLTANRSRRELQELALQDALTQLPNRRALEAAFQRASAAAGRGNGDSTIGLVVFDLDHFKRVNDVHGHQVGDEVLCHFARLATECVRPNDTLARLGGEEFALLLLDPGAGGAFDAAERVRTALAATSCATMADLPPVTVSAGVVTAPGEHADFQTMYRAADAALYRAKQEGRNRVASAATGDNPT